jgi:hypothetical protein
VVGYSIYVKKKTKHLAPNMYDIHTKIISEISFERFMSKKFSTGRQTVLEKTDLVINAQE